MKLESEGGFLEISRSDVGPPGTPGDGDLLLNVSTTVGSYAAADQSWVVAADWDGFLGELRTLEARRQGRAVLMGASPDDLTIEFFATDLRGTWPWPVAWAGPGLTDIVPSFVSVSASNQIGYRECFAISKH